MLVLTLLFPVSSVWDPHPVGWKPPTQLGYIFPFWFNIIQKISHKHSHTCVSYVFVDPVKLILSINQHNT